MCLHLIRPSRGHQVIEEVLGEHRPQIWVSDLYSAQRQHPAAQWQVCLAHQLRDCQFAIEAGNQVFAPVMKRVLLRAFVIHQRQGRLAESTLYQYRYDLKRRLEFCLALTPSQKDGVRLKKRYLGIRDNLFLFLEDVTVPPTNNSSEQTLRLSTIFRKKLSLRLESRPVRGGTLSGKHGSASRTFPVSSHSENPLNYQFSVSPGLSNYTNYIFSRVQLIHRVPLVDHRAIGCDLYNQVAQHALRVCSRGKSSLNLLGLVNGYLLAQKQKRISVGQP